MSYTTAEFRKAIVLAGRSAEAGSPYVYDAIAFEALEIAARVMEPGVIWGAILEGGSSSAFKDFDGDMDKFEAAIREALTHPKVPGQ